MVDAPETDPVTGSAWPRDPRAASGQKHTGEKDGEKDHEPIPTIADGIRESGRSIADLLQYIGLLITAKLDQLKLSIRALILYAALGVVGIIAAVAVVVVSVVLLLVGAAHGLGAALGGRDWLGDLIVSILILGAAGFSLSSVVGKFKTASRRRTMRKYEQRRK
jgi:hypothetical protein